MTDAFRKAAGELALVTAPSPGGDVFRDLGLLAKTADWADRVGPALTGLGGAIGGVGDHVRRASNWARANGIGSAAQGAAVGAGLGAALGGGTALLSPSRRRHALSATLTGGLAGAAIGGGGVLAADKIRNGPVLGGLKLPTSGGDVELSPDEAARAATLAEGANLLEKGVTGTIGGGLAAIKNTAPWTGFAVAPLAGAYAAYRGLGDRGFFNGAAGLVKGEQIKSPVFGGDPVASPTVKAIRDLVKGVGKTDGKGKVPAAGVTYGPDFGVTGQPTVTSPPPAPPTSKIPGLLPETADTVLDQHRALTEGGVTKGRLKDLSRQFQPEEWSAIHDLAGTGKDLADGQIVRRTLRSRLPIVGKHLPEFVTGRRLSLRSLGSGLGLGLGGLGLAEYAGSRALEDQRNTRDLNVLLAAAAARGAAKGK